MKLILWNYLMWAIAILFPSNQVIIAVKMSYCFKVAKWKLTTNYF